MGSQLLTADAAIVIAASVTGAALATAPTADAIESRNLQPRNGILLIEPLAGATVTLAAPTILVRKRGGTVYFDVGAIDRLSSGDLVMPGVGRAISVRDWLAWGDRLWVKSATVSGGNVKISFVPFQTYE